MKIICDKCEELIQIFSVTQIKDREVEIVFVCSGCGATKVTNNYLYKDITIGGGNYEKINE